MRAIKNKTWGLMIQASTTWILLEDLIASLLLNGFILQKKYRFYSKWCGGLYVVLKTKYQFRSVRYQITDEFRCETERHDGKLF